MMCQCKLCKLCGKPVAIKEGCPNHPIKDLVPTHNLASDDLCIKCEDHVVELWFYHHGISITFGEQ